MVKECHVPHIITKNLKTAVTEQKLLAGIKEMNTRFNNQEN